AHLPVAAVALAVSPDGRRLALGLINGTVQVWDVRQKTVAAAWVPHKSGLPFITTLAFGPDGKTLATGCENMVKVWDLVEGPGRPDRELIQGTWKAVAGEYDGDKKLTPDDLKTVTVTFEGDTMSVTQRLRSNR